MRFDRTDKVNVIYLDDKGIALTYRRVVLSATDMSLTYDEMAVEALLDELEKKDKE